MLQLSDHAIAMASVETAPVTRRELSRELRTVGKIQYDESSLATVTARVDGYAERLFVNFTGVEIKAGDHLVEVYSPDLIVAQQELLIALQGGGGRESGPLVETAKLKLKRWGMTDEQIDALFDLAQTDGIMPIVRRTARFNRHRDLIVSLFKHPPARKLFFRRMTGRSAAVL
jgi:hypothetical protein